MKNQLAADRHVEINIQSKNLYGKHSSSLSKPLSLVKSRLFSSSFKSKEKDNKNYASRILDHVKMGSKLSETLKGKLKLGSLIIQGGTENVFKQRFGMIQGEELLKSSQCYLSTTAGPFAGLLFISTEKVGFFSDRPITVHSPNSAQSISTHYKVMIPIRKIERGYKRENVKRAAEKYIEIVTKDGYEFWFMGFVGYHKAFDALQKALHFVTLFDSCFNNILIIIIIITIR